MTKPSLNGSFVTKRVKIREKSYEVNVWDTIGQEKFNGITKIFIKDSELVFIVYDITNRESFEKLDYWYNFIIEVLGENVMIGFIGYKQDSYKEEKVKEEEIKEYAQNKNAQYRTTSALYPESFKEFFQEQVEAYDNKTEEIVEIARGIKLNNKKIINQKNVVNILYF